MLVAVAFDVDTDLVSYYPHAQGIHCDFNINGIRHCHYAVVQGASCHAAVKRAMYVAHWHLAIYEQPLLQAI
jgi:hypothetical protein